MSASVQILISHREILRAVLVIHENGDGGAAEDPKKIGDDGEKEEHRDAGEDARGDQLAHRVDAEGTHGINLFGYDHGAEFTGHGGSIAAGNHDAGETGPKFANHGRATNRPVTAVAPNCDRVAAD